MKRVAAVASLVLTALFAVESPPSLAAPWAPSAQAPQRVESAQPETFRLSPGAKSARRFALGSVDADAIAQARQRNSSRDTKYLEIGIGRTVSKALAATSGSLAWERVPGGMAAHWEISSTDALALRVELQVERMPPGAEIRLAGNRDGDKVYGPFTASDVPAGQSAWWSPVLEGDSATIEVFLRDGVKPSELSIEISRLSHLFASPSNPRSIQLLALGEGTSQACEVDFICRSPADPALASLGKAVARLTITDPANGLSGYCSGTLLSTPGFLPYVFSAAHCLLAGATSPPQAMASTIATHWFFDRSGCGSGGTIPTAVQVAGGMAVLHISQSSDVLFMRMNRNPPSSAFYAGWDASTVGSSAAFTAVHHPNGDWKKVSLGRMGGFSGYNGTSGDDHIIAIWNSTATGVTEGGSSGSGIFTAVGQPATDYLLRGGLHGGPSSCTATGTGLRDYYSRLDRAYGFLQPYMDPNYTSLWWNAAESGWGINLNHQGDIVFGTLFTYDSTGAPMWLVMSSGALQSDGATFSGPLYRTTGPAFNANPFTPITAANLTQVGTMAVTFAGPDNATLSYSVNGVQVNKAITRQVYSTSAAVCGWSTGNRASATNYQDLWWNPAESGWGVNITHQGSTLFATLFTYDSTGKGLWLVMSAGLRQADGSYLGDLLRTTGPAFNANPFTPIGAANVSTVGTMRFRFTDGNNGTLTYTYNGATVTKAITRQTFATSVPVCSS